MNDSIYKVIYCSRNHIAGSPEEIRAEIQKILNSSRMNNPRWEITGALLFNEGLFVQVLEGPVDAVGALFETIQRDPRHSDVTVLQSGTAEGRDFPEWSMAFAAPDEKFLPGFGIPAFDAIKFNPSAAAAQVLKLLHDVVVQDDWIMA